MPLPDSTSRPGWPDSLIGTDGLDYTLVRDGIPGANEYCGHACLYVRGDATGYDTDYLYTPTADSTEEAVHMSGGVYMSPDELVAAGLPPTQLP